LFLIFLRLVVTTKEGKKAVPFFEKKMSLSCKDKGYKGYKGHKQACFLFQKPRHRTLNLLKITNQVLYQCYSQGKLKPKS